MARVVVITTSNISRRLVKVILAVLCLSPAALLANEFELARLVSELHLASTQLANEVRDTRGQGDMRSYIKRLSRETASLMKAIQRDRSRASLRSEFTAVSRRYQTLEDAFLRFNKSGRDPQQFHALRLISSLHRNLSREFYLTNYLKPSLTVNHGDSSINSRRAVPPADSGRSNIHSDRSSRRFSSVPERRYNRPIITSRGLNFDHRSSVLDRRYRENSRRQMGIASDRYRSRFLNNHTDITRSFGGRH